MLHRSKIKNITLFKIALLLIPTFLSAQEISGHLKSQATTLHFEEDDLSATLGSDTMHQATLDARLNLVWQSGKHELTINQENLAFQGDGFKVLREQSTAIPNRQLPNSFPSDRTRLLDMTVNSISESEFLLVNRIDRLSYSYSTEKSVTKVGRQALSWGNGLTFSVLDFLNPFSPTAIDKDYKTGDDMLYQQVLFSNGSDLQFSVVPRREEESRDLEGQQSTFAVKYSAREDHTELNYDMILSRHYNDNLLGLGLSRDLFEAVIRGDLAFYDLDNGDQEFSFLVNIDRSFSFLDRNLYLLIEYLHSGFGVNNSDYLNGSDQLYERINRGELYTLAINYLAYGARMEIEPRLNLFGNFIHNLDDSSAYFQIRSVFEVMQDLEVICGVNIPIGARDTEFGGIRLPNQTFIAPAEQAYLRVAWYW